MQLLKRYHRFILATYLFCNKKPKLTLSLATLAFIISLFFSTQLQFLVMVGDLLDTNFKTYSQFHELNENFIEENGISLIVKSVGERKELSHEQHCALIDWMNTVVNENENIVKVVSTYGVRTLSFEDQKLRAKPVLIDTCTEKNPKSEIILKEQLKQISQHPSGVYLTSKNADDVMIILYLKSLTKTSTFGSFDIQSVEQIRNSFNIQILQKFKDLNPVWSGAGTYQFYLQKAYVQMLVVNLLTALVSLLFFKYFFGNWKSGIIFLLTIGFTLTILYGLMGAFNFPIDSISCAVPIMLLLSTLEDFVYILYLQKQGYSWRKSIKKMLIPAFATSFTTFIGFLSLGFTDLKIIARFGIICAIGALIEWIVTFLILPTFLNYFKIDKSWIASSNRKNKFIKQLSNFSLPKPYVVAAPLVFIISLVGFNKLHISDSPEEIFPERHPVPMASKFMLDSRDWKAELSLIFPSQITESEKNNIINNIKNTNSIVKFTESSSEVINKSIFKATETEQQLLLSYWRDSQFSDRWISKVNGLERIILFTDTSNVVAIDQLRQNILSICNGKCHPANILVSYSEFGLRTLQVLLDSFGGSIAFVTIFLLFLALSLKIKNITALLLSALWGPFALLSLFIVFQVEVFFATSVVMSVLVALAGDNTIQYIYAKSKNNLHSGIDKLSEASIICTIMMMGLSLCFLISDFAGVQKIGLMMFFGFLLILFGDLFLLRGFLNFKKK